MMLPLHGALVALHCECTLAAPVRVGTTASLVGRRVMACKAAEILKCCGFQALRGWLFPRSPARPGPRGDEMRREVLVPAPGGMCGGRHGRDDAAAANKISDT